MDLKGTEKEKKNIPVHSGRLRKGSLWGFKIVSGEQLRENSFAGQTEADWSAVYGQFGVDNAVRYLPNHWDRGAEAACLVALRVAREVNVIVLDDGLLKVSEVSSKIKADRVREAMGTHGVTIPGGGPLLKSFGKAKTLLVTYDEEEMEWICPHELMFCSTPVLQSKVLAVFKRKSICDTGKAKLVMDHEASANELESSELELSRMEREDAGTLARRITKELVAKGETVQVNFKECVKDLVKLEISP